MNKQEIAEKLNKIHIRNAKQLSLIANILTSSGEAGVLLWLNGQEKDVFAIDIIEHFGLTPGRVANILKKLENKGYLAREHDVEDLRKSFIRLTGEGKKYAGELFARMNENHLRLAEMLGEKDSSEALRILEKLLSVTENNDDFSMPG